MKTQGLLTHKLYQQKSVRERYAKTMMGILENRWNETELLAEVDRIDVMVEPHLVNAQRFFGDKEGGKTLFTCTGTAKRRGGFIRERRADITEEIAGGMPEWKAVPDEPFVTRGDDWAKQREKSPGNDIWSAAAFGNIKAVKEHLVNRCGYQCQG